eukprot:2384883-Rhodomonas_salina.2
MPRANSLTSSSPKSTPFLDPRSATHHAPLLSFSLSAPYPLSLLSLSLRLLLSPSSSSPSSSSPSAAPARVRLQCREPDSGERGEQELGRRLPAGSGVTAAALHPGVIQTELG